MALPNRKIQRPVVSLAVPAHAAPEFSLKVSSKGTNCGINWQYILSENSSPMQLQKFATMMGLPSNLPTSFWIRNFKYILQDQQTTGVQLQ